MRRCCGFHITALPLKVFGAHRFFSTPGKIKVNVITQDGTQVDYESPTGISLMSSIKNVAQLDMLGMCEGRLECATCHIRLSEKWAKKVPLPSATEQDLLDQLDDCQSTSRLCCQIPLTPEMDGIEASMKEETKN